jgi:hypothetical protein
VVDLDKRKPSEIIEEFLVFLENANSEHIACEQTVELCNKRNIDYLHDMEFAKDKSERNRIATKIHNNQVQRRKAKDRCMELENPAAFFVDKSNKPFIGQLKRLLKVQKDKEAYLEKDREYIRRAGDEE